MTQPGAPLFPSPGWWVRGNRVGVNTNLGYGWAGTASGVMHPKGHVATSYGLSANAVGAYPSPPVYLGNNATGAFGITATLTYTDTVPANTKMSLIWVANFSSITAPTVSASIGGVAATLPTGNSVILDDNGTNGLWLHCFVVPNPLTGSRTISFTTTAAAAAVVDAVHYQHAGSIGTPISLTYQSGTSCSLTAPSSNARLAYANAFAYAGTVSQTFSAYNQTQRFLKAVVSGGNRALICGDAVGNGSGLVFSATRSNTARWGGLIVPLIP